ncbi:MAG: DUF6588 family protein [Cyclobacteriaceae bacterium]
MKKLLASLFIFSLAVTAVRAQSLDDLTNLIKGSKADANYLMEGYLAPALNGIGYGLNQGWYNTAKPHKTLGFDVTFTLSVITFPTAERSFQVDNNKLTSLQLDDPAFADGKVPTLIGESETGPTYSFKNGLPGSFKGPGAIPGLNKLPVIGVPMPIANIGIGLFKGTEVKLRYVPTLDQDGIKLDMLGVALMHDIKQHIPVVKNLPFDLSILAGYTKLSVGYMFDQAAGQEAALNATAMTVQAIVSKKLALLTLYAALGYNKSDVKLDVKGDYELTPAQDGIPAVNITDPVSLTAAGSGARLTGGVRIRLALINLHADYTLQKYPTISAGVGIGIR